MRYRILGLLVLGTFAGGCNALDEPGTDDNSKLVVPTDTRAAVQALRTPPPISGGTMAVTPDGAVAVLADPDRDRISLVELATQRVHHVALDEGAEPGRVLIDAPGRAHVLLRGSGSVATVDLVTGELLGEHAVCATPRGMALQADTGLLRVACASGELVAIDRLTGEKVSVLKLGVDLRDVIVAPAPYSQVVGVPAAPQLLVSTFKSAELLSVDEGAGTVAGRRRPPVVTADSMVQSPDGSFTFRTSPMQPHLAWRTAGQVDGSVLMVHQVEDETEIDIESEPVPGMVSSYGGGSEEAGVQCSGVVRTSITEFRPESPSAYRTAVVAGSVLAVDIARSPTGTIAIATAGSVDPEAPRPFTIFDDENTVHGTSGVALAAPPQAFSPSSVNPDAPGRVLVMHGGGLLANTQPSLRQNCQFPSSIGIPGQATAVAFLPDGRLLVQTREPARLVMLPAGLFDVPTVIELEGESVLDTGHDLFHRDSGGGIACASCHGEGGDDGHTWLFSSTGPRRTQAVNVGLAGTAPFHWDGDMKNLGVLMNEVFVGRMGGVHQSKGRRGVLEDWLFSLEPPKPILRSGDPAVKRGKLVFESGQAGCTGCHAGEQMTDNKSYHVGTTNPDEPLQVPSLRGVGYRAPFLHDGCAPTLRERFEPSCGGDRHGGTEHLSEADLDDLVAYLQSL